MMNITTKTKWPDALLIVAFALAAGGVRAQDQQSQQPTLALADAVTVNDLAAKPGEHLGRVQLVGVVAASHKGKALCWWTSASVPIAA
jgi:hypothetical protein